MAAERKMVIRCAIYTRKSSEEGLEQSFNSLDAQREACQAYVVSQRHEGWHPIATRYDDGGFSGGNIHRPALKSLLEDIDAGKVDTVVVYKVDRLTRSLSDFAKIIETFDAHKVSFVSITQQFNTTTSMGRLTLNVLLSFAQFEREVTGERIRDKIAASKRKGMWMGGRVPLGYDLKDRKLVVNLEEADHVRKVYRRYLQLGCVFKLKRDLDRQGITSKERTSKAGNKSGGASYSRGALYEILQNRLYLGEIAHKDQVYPGEHAAIIKRDLWDKVQARLKANTQGKRNGLRQNTPSLLVGLIFDKNGNRFTPSHAVKKDKRYLYYVSRAVIQKTNDVREGPARIPADELESLLSSKLHSFLASGQEVVKQLCGASGNASLTQKIVVAAQQKNMGWTASSIVEKSYFLRAVLARVVVHETRIELVINKEKMRETLVGTASSRKDMPISSDAVEFFTLKIEARVKRCGREVRLVLPAGSTEQVLRTDPSLLKAIARAHDWYERLLAGEINSRSSIGRIAGLQERYVGRILQYAFLAPDIVEAIATGRQPENLSLEKLRGLLPIGWIAQRDHLGAGTNRHGIPHD